MVMKEKPVVDPDALLDQHEVARILRVTTKFLEAKRSLGGSVPFIKVGRLVRYRRSDVLAWIDEQRRTSTSE